MDRDIADLSGSELLDHVGELSLTARRCEAGVLVAAVQHAVLHNEDSLDRSVAELPGRERAVRFGGEGTQRVAEFAAAEFGARLGISSYAGRALIADALDLAHRVDHTGTRRLAATSSADQSLTRLEANFVDLVPDRSA